MTFTVNSLSRCSGGGEHYTLGLSLASGQTGNLAATRDEMAGEPPDSIGEARERLVGRIRSALKEANAGTFAQAQAALVGKTFKV